MLTMRPNRRRIMLSTVALIRKMGVSMLASIARNQSSWFSLASPGLADPRKNNRLRRLFEHSSGTNFSASPPQESLRSNGHANSASMSEAIEQAWRLGTGQFADGQAENIMVKKGPSRVRLFQAVEGILFGVG